MMSKLVTPPDIITEDIVYLLVNPTLTDIEMVTRYLQISNKEFTIHLYYDGMSDVNWVNETAKISSRVIINKVDTSNDTITPLLNYVNKLIWVGKDQTYKTAMDYLYNNV